MHSNVQRFKRVSIGLGLMLASVVVIYLYVVSSLLTPLLVSIDLPTLTKSVLMIQIRFAFPIILTSMILGVAGPCLCLAAPRDAKATTHVLIVIALNAVSSLTLAVSQVVSLPGWFRFVALLSPYIAIPVFVLFVRRIALYLDRQDIVKLCRGFFVFAGVAMGIGVLPTSIKALGIELGTSALFLAFAWPILMLAFTVLAFLRYLRILEYARRATNHAERFDGSVTDASTKGN